MYVPGVRAKEKPARIRKIQAGSYKKYLKVSIHLKSKEVKFIMAGRIKHMERSHRSYKNKDAAFRGFHIHASESKYYRGTRKSLAEQLASFMALLSLGHRKQSK